MKVRSSSAFEKMLVVLAVLIACFGITSDAQQTTSVVPTLVNFSGTLTDASGKPLTGTVGVTFYLYKDDQGGSPLWMETQNVQSDKAGHYTVALGSSKNEGLPTSLFASGEARWLAVQAQGQAEQPRVLLLSVPYALKAGDAQTIGGLSPSAFVLAASPNSGSSAGSSLGSNSDPNAPPLGGTGTTDYLPIWTNSTTLGSSVLFQSGTGAKAKVGIGTTKPASTLDVKGGGTIRGLFSLPATGTATAKAGFNSQPIDLGASVFNSGTSTAVTQTFQWQAEPVGNNTANATGSLNLLFAQGTGKANETGLNIASNGQITFAKGQTFPGTGNGTITGVIAGTDLTGGGSTGNVTLNVDTTKVVTGVTAGTDLTGGGAGGNLTLNLDTTKVPQLKTANTFTGNQTINGNVSDTGNISATGSITGQTGVFSASNSTQVVNVTQSGSGTAINATVPTNSSAFTPAIQGTANGANAYGIGVQGNSSAVDGYGVLGEETNSSANTDGYGVAGSTQTPYGAGVVGFGGSTASGATADGVFGSTGAPNGIGVDGYNANSTSGIGVRGSTSATTGIGVYGFWTSASSIGSGYSEIGVWGDSSSGNGVLGTSDNGYGVEAVSNNNYAVYAFSNNNDGVYGFSGASFGIDGFGAEAGVNGGTTYGIGVSGGASASDGISGVYGVVASPSVSGEGLSIAGVWGDSGGNNSFGVAGTTDNGNSFFGKNNTVNHETLYIENDSGFSGGFTPYAARFAGPGSSTYCSIVRDLADNGTGDLDCTGSINGAVVVGGSRMVNMYAVEAADNWFEDAGSGQLANGSTTISLDQVFAQTVNGDVDYHVFLTPNGDCEGLYVTKKGAQGFEVHELHGGHSNVAFDYRIMARRKGFEKVRMQDVTQDFAHMKQESDQLAARVEARKQEQKAHPIMKPAVLPRPKPVTTPSFHPGTPHTPVFPPKQSLIGSIK